MKNAHRRYEPNKTVINGQDQRNRQKKQFPVDQKWGRKIGSESTKAKQVGGGIRKGTDHLHLKANRRRRHWTRRSARQLAAPL